MSNDKILFIIKERNDSYGNSIGLMNSVSFTSLALRRHGWNTDFVHVVDGNGVDKEVHCYKPKLVIIEALWLSALKLKELMRLHKHVKWVIRLHSKIPFLSGEGTAIQLIKEYQNLPHQDRLTISFNNAQANNDFNAVLGEGYYFLPNLYYKPDYTPTEPWYPDGKLRISCFGSLRPLKCQLLQAFSAIVVAERMKVKLHFYINATRMEQKGESILKNMRALFKGSVHDLHETGWLKHKDFLHLVKKMDVGLQVSYSESFNIVAADFCHAGIPIVVSQEINWLPAFCQVSDPNDMIGIADKVEYLLNNRKLAVDNSVKSLARYNRRGVKIWEKFLVEQL